MNTTQIELLFMALFGLGIGVYYIGRKKKNNLIRCIGRQGAIVSFILLIISLFVKKDLFN